MMLGDIRIFKFLNFRSRLTYNVVLASGVQHRG